MIPEVVPAELFLTLKAVGDPPRLIENWDINAPEHIVLLLKVTRRPLVLKGVYFRLSSNIL
jgi:hypothetical protein